MAFHKMLNAELHDGPLTAGITQARAQRAIIGELHHGRGKTFAVMWWNDNTCFTIDDRFGVAPHAGHDHRQASRHAFKNCVGEAFLM